MIRRRLLNWWTRIHATVLPDTDTRDPEFQSEIEEHVQLLAERYRGQGMTPEAAMRAARRQFGNTTLLEEDRRSLKVFPAIESAWADLTYAVRMLRKNPGFTAAAVVTLALGIGANTAIFSVCNAVLFKPLPYAEPGRIVTLWERQRDGLLSEVAPANFVDWRDASRSFSGMGAVRAPSFASSFILGGQNEASRLAGGDVSAGFFSVLGVRFVLGRNFRPDEDRPGNHIAILSYPTWRARFGADRDIVGKAITLDDHGYTVVGVLPADFRFGSTAADFQARSQPDVWVPLGLDPQRPQRNAHMLRVIARLAPGVTRTQAQAELDRLAATMARMYPDQNRDRGIRAVSLAERVTATVRGPLRMLLGAVGLVLLIACANVANLLLSRAAARQTEMAVRVALGASHGRLIRQLLTESLLLAGIGGAAGLLVALAVTSALSSHLPPDLSRAAGMAGDMRILAFTAVISLATGIIFGMGPLVGTRRISAGESLKQSFRVAGSSHSRLRNVLAVAQMSIAIILLIGAGLMAKSLRALTHVSPGFHTDRVLTARLSLPGSRYPDNRRIAAFERELLQTLSRRPAVLSAGLATYLPLGGLDNESSFIVEGRPPLPVGMYNPAQYRPASAGYFETIGIPVVRGRSFTAADRADSPWVTVINESMAREYWGGQDPIGRRLQLGPGEPWRAVIGVVGDVLHEGLDGEAKPEMYVPMDQSFNTESEPTVVVRTALETGAAAGELREVVAAIDRTIPVDRIQTMEQLVSGSVAQPRFRTLVLAAFSILALVMASIGIYGVMTYLVVQRTREFGIRVSMGATRGDVLRLVLGRAAALIGAGACVGIAGSVGLVRLIAKLLFGTTPLDPLTFAAAPALLAAVALAASYLPARRATRVDPMEALRVE